MSPTGFHSGRTIRHVPKMLKSGFIEEVTWGEGGWSRGGGGVGGWRGGGLEGGGGWRVE